MNKFNHIYIESNLINTPKADAILKHFTNANIIEINHYKDIFNRNHQDFSKQKEHPALILAEKKGELLYEGAKVCQSFGNSHFYYTSLIMNCIYGCEYCYLSGMYPSANIVMFLNYEDYFLEVERYLAIHPMYICISYDTDLLALNSITGFLNKWIEFTDSHENLTIEIRTKCGNLASILDSIASLEHPERIIFAYTISPREIVEKYEAHTSSLDTRVEAITRLQSMGMTCRIAFDPMIYIPGWRQAYEDMAAFVFSEIDSSKLLDISIGTFRISKEYVKAMRKAYPASSIAQFPYSCVDEVYQYPDDIMRDMEDFMEEKCLTHISKDKIFRWEE